MTRQKRISGTLTLSNRISQIGFVICLFASQFIAFSTSYAQAKEVDSSRMEGAETASTQSQVDLTTDDVAYLTQLGLLRGHLLVGFELYRRSMPEMSETHMKHPREELYSELIPAFKRRGCDGFADELTELASVVASRAATEVVTSNFESLNAAIRQCEGVAEYEDQVVVTQVVRNLLGNALVEYEIGVIDGSIDNVHEYQDAWGFTQIAGNYARSPAFLKNDEGRLITRQLQSLISSLEPLWPSLNPSSVDASSVSRLLNRLRMYTDGASQRNKP